MPYFTAAEGTGEAAWAAPPGAALGLFLWEGKQLREPLCIHAAFHPANYETGRKKIKKLSLFSPVSLELLGHLPKQRVNRPPSMARSREWKDIPHVSQSVSLLPGVWPEPGPVGETIRGCGPGSLCTEKGQQVCLEVRHAGDLEGFLIPSVHSPGPAHPGL